MLIEGLRTDSLMLGPIRISQLVGFVSFVFGIVFCVFRAKQAAKMKNAETEYTALYDKAANTADAADIAENTQIAAKDTQTSENMEDDHGTDH